MTSVAVNSPPVVTFQITDANNRGLKGLGAASKSSTALHAGLNNVRFTIAKLVPGANGSPSKWVNYIVTSTPTTTAAEVPSTPSTDQHGTLVDNGDGTYKYTFLRDITKIKEKVAAATLTAPNVAADLGDLTYDPTKVHRLVIQVSGAKPGTGSNTPTGAASGVASVNMGAAANIVFDWVPATGKVVAPTDPDQKELVSISSCNECHNQLAFHGGGRVDTKYCVVCHTDQRKYGKTNVASTAGKFPALVEKAVVDPVTGITTFLYSKNTTATSTSYHPTGTDPTYVADGEVVGDFPITIHKIHMGKDLTKQNYNYANVVFNNKGYSMLGGGQKMCLKCHNSSKAAQADNFKMKPSRQACGACHDNINWTTGAGHIGSSQANDSLCAICHKPEQIVAYHQTENVTKNNPTVAAGLKNFTYEIKSATVDSTTNNVKVVFRVLADGTPVTFKAPAAGLTTSLDGFTGGPSFLLAYAMDASATDGIALPGEYTNTGIKQAQAISVPLADLLNTSKTDGTLAAGPGAGEYTATLLGTGTKKFPVGAKMRAVALQGYYTQVSPAAARHTISVVKEVTGDAVRRKVVDPDKCSNCHEWFEGHGGNRVYQTQVCVMCHVPGLATSGRGIPDSRMNTWNFDTAAQAILSWWKFDKTVTNAALALPVTTNNFKDMIHGIHAGRDRVSPFRDARDRTSATGGVIQLLDFARMDFPGKLNECQTCHVPGTYSSVPMNSLPSTYESIDAAYAAGIAAGTATPALANAALSKVSGTDRVTSPFAAACVSCHDAPSAKAHIATQGGKLQVARSGVAGGGEACQTCHGPGKGEDPAVVHK